MKIPSEIPQLQDTVDGNSQGNSHSLGDHDSASLKDELNKSLDVDRKKRQQLILKNPEFQIKQEIEDEKQNIKVETLIRRELANSINIKDLLKLKISSKDLKNPIHSLFRWILLIFYKENPDLYNWLEFKEQILEKNNGEDLVNRFGYQNVMYITRLEGEKTKFLLNLKQKILEENGQPEVAKNVLIKIFDMVEIVYKIYEHAKGINHLVDELIKQEDNINQYKVEIQKINHHIQETKISLKSLENKSQNDENLSQNDEIVKE
ncbi:unnamed protein product [Paramecium pentaurelia]|uniref:Uncharacterized protein n=1 Tax=Paramecium pentaurelia TaxID=43138 RepID=A0A8S1XGB6_9CILI|nr:unnamed protein product [Paramecium pentaurelia]